jgi:hypothetical protein
MEGDLHLSLLRHLDDPIHNNSIFSQTPQFIPRHSSDSLTHILPSTLFILTDPIWKLTLWGSCHPLRLIDVLM